MAAAVGPNTPKQCYHCQKDLDKVARCGRCLKAIYCDKACQTADWSKHKILCPTLAAQGRKDAVDDTISRVKATHAQMKAAKLPQITTSQQGQTLYAAVQAHPTPQNMEAFIKYAQSGLQAQLAYLTQMQQHVADFNKAKKKLEKKLGAHLAELESSTPSQNSKTAKK